MDCWTSRATNNKELPMFGDPPPTNGRVSLWLAKLQDFQPAERHGELVHKNVLEDSNVCGEYRDEVRRFIDARSEVGEPHQAMSLYNELVEFLPSNDCGYVGDKNAANRLHGFPFTQCGRVVSAEKFVKYNATPSPAKKTRRGLHRKAVGGRHALNRIGRIGMDIRNLRGQIGTDPMFAADSASFQPDPHGQFDADEIRNCVGLDDSQYAAGREIVILWYQASRIPNGACYRPTVLDAGSHPAFKPSPSGTPAPGWTQHLETGAEGVREVIHAPLDANQIDRFQVAGPLTTDPPQAYKTIRLGP